MKKLLVCLLTAVLTFGVSGCCDVVYEAFYVEGDTSDVQIDYGESALYTKTDMDAAVEVIKENFRRCRGCVLHRVRYVSDAECSVQNLERLKALQKAVDAGEAFTQCILFRIDFHSAKHDPNGFVFDAEYTEWNQWLLRADGGDWILIDGGEG